MLIRKAYAEKKKKKSLPKVLDSLFIANCVSLATRVHVDVMKAIPRRLTNQTDLVYIAGFTSKPMMHNFPKVYFFLQKSLYNNNEWYSKCKDLHV
jgi:hypothetical protein